MVRSVGARPLACRAASPRTDRRGRTAAGHVSGGGERGGALRYGLLRGAAGSGGAGPPGGVRRHAGGRHLSQWMTWRTVPLVVLRVGRVRRREHGGDADGWVVRPRHFRMRVPPGPATNGAWRTRRYVGPSMRGRPGRRQPRPGCSRGGACRRDLAIGATQASRIGKPRDFHSGARPCRGARHRATAPSSRASWGSGVGGRSVRESHGTMAPRSRAAPRCGDRRKLSWRGSGRIDAAPGRSPALAPPSIPASIA